MEGQHRKSWLAAYTRSCHERHVADQLQSKSLEFLLPTYERSVRWSDRIKCCPAPLFPGYFVQQSAFPLADRIAAGGAEELSAQE